MFERRIKDNFFSNSSYCFKCNKDLYFTNASLMYAFKCEDHYENKRPDKCNICKLQSVICRTCLRQSETRQSKSTESDKINRTKVHKKYSYSYFTIILSLGLSVFFGLLYNYTSKIDSGSSNVVLENENLKIINELRRRYPSQKNETWYHFLSVLEKEVPTVKSITFLHGEDKKTSECLTNELVSLYTENKKVKSEEITFYNSEYEVEDYGIVLEHYRQTVKRFRVFITDLSKVSGNTAKIFHSLCDEVSSDVKPSLFIFTLMYNKRTEDLKPIERATAILKEAWNDLPENEIFPLFSRILKNVIDIIPEKKNIL